MVKLEHFSQLLNVFAFQQIHLVQKTLPIVQPFSGQVVPGEVLAKGQDCNFSFKIMNGRRNKPEALQ